MITTLITLLIAGLVLYVIYYIVGMFIKGQPLKIIGIILGLPLFQELFNERWCTDLEGGLLEAFGRLFKNQVRVYVYPMGNPLTGQVLNINDARVSPEQKHLLRYLVETKCVRPLEEPNHDFLFHTSAEVRNMIHARDSHWQSLVPDIVLQQGPWRESAQPVMERLRS